MCSHVFTTFGPITYLSVPLHAKPPKGTLSPWKRWMSQSEQTDSDFHQESTSPAGKCQLPRRSSLPAVVQARCRLPSTTVAESPPLQCGGLASNPRSNGNDHAHETRWATIAARSTRSPLVGNRIDRPSCCVTKTGKAIYSC